MKQIRKLFPGSGQTEMMTVEGIVKLTEGLGDNWLMESLYRRHRFPPEIISYAV